MTHCDVQASGAIELYFYDELEATERASIDRHLARRAANAATRWTRCR